MGNPKGFLIYDRELPSGREIKKRLKDYQEVYERFPVNKTKEQAARCMDCGVPFCHSGCPLGNVIPEFNDAVYRSDWKEAHLILASTNNFPEFTGRICPAPCEASCVLGINQPPVAIEHIEKTIIETAYRKDYIKASPPPKRSGKKIAVVGSGPAGLAAADQLNKTGHTVTLFERNDRIGGLLRYGIPDFKLEKWVIDRRLKLMEDEGVIFRTSTNVGVDIKGTQLLKEFDAVVLCGGSTIPRDLKVPGRENQGIHFAMEFLEQNNRRVAGEKIDPLKNIHAKDKHVVVIGGGDTGSDCVGTSNRHGAKSVTQIEILGKPPISRKASNPWPEWPMVLRTSSSHEEGCERKWAILTKEFLGNGEGQLTGLKIVDVEWHQNAEGRHELLEIPDSERIIMADLVFLAMGYLHPQHKGLLKQLKVDFTDRGNVKDQNFATNIDKVFTAGDMRRGQSLVVWAITEGRQVADRVHEYLAKA